MIELYNEDCIGYMKTAIESGVRYNLTLTDIPYGEVNGEDHFNGLRSYTRNRGDADKLTFNIDEFLKLVYEITDDIIIIFCGMGQFSHIFNFFKRFQLEKKGTVRQIVWEKANPCPMNGHNAYLNGIENAVWFKKSGSKRFYHKYRNTVFKHNLFSCKKIHPTEKNHLLIKELIEGNSRIGDSVFDPCAGSASTLLVGYQMNRSVVGCEINTQYYTDALNRINNRVAKMCKEGKK